MYQQYGQRFSLPRRLNSVGFTITDSLSQGVWTRSNHLNDPTELFPWLVLWDTNRPIPRACLINEKNRSFRLWESRKWILLNFYAYLSTLSLWRMRPLKKSKELPSGCNSYNSPFEVSDFKNLPGNPKLVMRPHEGTTIFFLLTQKEQVPLSWLEFLFLPPLWSHSAWNVTNSDSTFLQRGQILP